MFIALTEKENNKDYQQSEIDILNIFSSEISLYIQRNQVLKKLHEREKEKFRLEKLAALGQLTAGITHEIRNPLNTISSAAQTLSGKKLNSEQQQRMLNYINEEVERISDLMTDFLKLSILKIPEYETTELCKLFEKVKVYVSERNSSVKMAVINKLSENIKTDKKYLYQILINLVSNAVDAIEKNCYNTDFPCSKGLITLNINQTEKSYILKIEDNGSGVPKEIREKIFEPFFTSKENGTGLGLALVSNMVKSLDGSIMLLPSENKTVFKILLPQKK